MEKIYDQHIRGYHPITTPKQLSEDIPLNGGTKTVLSARHEIRQILEGKSSKRLLVVGPCSIHDPAAALDYARRLKEQRERYADTLEIVMRVYFEKPRTTVGWKGYINDPRLDGSFRINEGLRAARQLLLDVNALGLPAATEFLDLLSPQYIADLIAWGAIGARTTESQTHREMASGLSMPLGFKNSTDGSFTAAVNAIKAASQPQTFLGINLDGSIAYYNFTLIVVAIALYVIARFVNSPFGASLAGTRRQGAVTPTGSPPPSRAPAARSRRADHLSAASRCSSVSQPLRHARS